MCIVLTLAMVVLAWNCVAYFYFIS